MPDPVKKSYRFRAVVPGEAHFHIFSLSDSRTTSLGPVCVASIVDKMDGWDAEVIDENNLGKQGPKSGYGRADHGSLQQLRPANVVGLYGGITSLIPRLYEIARFYKSKGVITIAGGRHFTEETIPEALSSGVDYVVIGEGEETIRELIGALEKKRNLNEVNGIAYLDSGKVIFTQKRAPITDFDSLPLPDFSLVKYARIVLYPIERIRGCWMNCEFCSVKRKPQYSSPERTLERIGSLVETQGAREFLVVDDLFGHQRNETIRFCKMVRDYQKKTGIKFTFKVQIRLDKAKDHELLSAMRQAGFKWVAIGFESPIGEELKAMDKHLKAEDMVSLAKVFRKFGFLVHGLFMFGYPSKKGEKFSMPAAKRIRHFRDFIERSQLDTMHVVLPVPAPGTELRNRLKKEKRLYPLKDVSWKYYDGNFPLFEPDSPMTAEDMRVSPMKIMNRFYRFKYIFLAALHIISLPGIVFFLRDIKAGWRRWHRACHNYLIRFVGWIFLRKGTLALEKDIFTRKLQSAKEHLREM